MRRARLLRFANTPAVSVATPHATHKDLPEHVVHDRLLNYVHSDHNRGLPDRPRRKAPAREILRPRHARGRSSGRGRYERSGPQAALAQVAIPGGDANAGQQASVRSPSRRGVSPAGSTVLATRMSEAPATKTGVATVAYNSDTHAEEVPP